MLCLYFQYAGLFMKQLTFLEQEIDKKERLT